MRFWFIVLASILVSIDAFTLPYGLLKGVFPAFGWVVLVYAIGQRLSGEKWFLLMLGTIFIAVFIKESFWEISWGYPDFATNLYTVLIFLTSLILFFSIWYVVKNIHCLEKNLREILILLICSLLLIVPRLFLFLPRQFYANLIVHYGFVMYSLNIILVSLAFVLFSVVINSLCHKVRYWIYLMIGTATFILNISPTLAIYLGLDVTSQIYAASLFMMFTISYSFIFLGFLLLTNVDFIKRVWNIEG